jgi:hypothetical protein
VAQQEMVFLEGPIGIELYADGPCCNWRIDFCQGEPETGFIIATLGHEYSVGECASDESVCDP